MLMSVKIPGNQSLVLKVANHKKLSGECALVTEKQKICLSSSCVFHSDWFSFTVLLAKKTTLFIRLGLNKIFFQSSDLRRGNISNRSHFSYSKQQHSQLITCWHWTIRQQLSQSQAQLSDHEAKPHTPLSSFISSWTGCVVAPDRSVSVLLLCCIDKAIMLSEGGGVK